MARIIMLQKRNTNWLSRKIEAQRERSGVRGKGLGVGFGGRGFGVPPTNGPGWLQGYPLTIPDTPSLLFLTAHFWYYNFRLSGSSTRRMQLLISDFPLKHRFSEENLKTGPKAVRFLVSPLFVDCPSTEMYQPSLSPKKEHPPPHSPLSLIPHAGPSLRVNVFETERPSYAYFITQLYELWEAYAVSELLAAQRSYQPAGSFRGLDRFHSRFHLTIYWESIAICFVVSCVA